MTPEQAYDEICALGENHALIFQAVAGVVVIVHPDTQKEQGIYEQIQHVHGLAKNNRQEAHNKEINSKKTAEGDTLKAIVRHLPFPSDVGEQTIEVLYQEGDPAFVCGAHGSITGDMIKIIEKDFADNRDEGFDRGDGIYLYVPRWESPQIGDYGRIELPGYWDLELVGFKPIEQAMSNNKLDNKNKEAK